MRWLREHWEIKILALVLACTLYFFIGGVTRLERTFSVKVQDSDLIDLPTAYEIDEVSPREFKIVVSGPRAILESAKEHQIRPRLEIDPEKIANGHQDFVVTTRLLGLPAELVIDKQEADGIRVIVSRIEQQEFPLSGAEIPIKDLAPGLRVEETTPEVNRILLRGTKRSLEALKARKQPLIAPVSLSDVPADTKQTVERVVPLRLDLGSGVRTAMEGQLVRAVIRIGPQHEPRTIAVPVSVLAPHGFFSQYEVDIDPKQIALSVSGPKNLLDATNLAELVIAYLDLTGKPVLDVLRPLPVKVIAPAWATVGPGQVQVTIRGRSKPAAPPPVAPTPAPVPALPSGEVKP